MLLLCMPVGMAPQGTSEHKGPRALAQCFSGYLSSHWWSLECIAIVHAPLVQTLMNWWATFLMVTFDRDFLVPLAFWAQSASAALVDPIHKMCRGTSYT